MSWRPLPQPASTATAGCGDGPLLVHLRARKRPQAWLLRQERGVHAGLSRAGCKSLCLGREIRAFRGCREARIDGEGFPARLPGDLLANLYLKQVVLIVPRLSCRGVFRWGRFCFFESSSTFYTFASFTFPEKIHLFFGDTPAGSSVCARKIKSGGVPAIAAGQPESGREMLHSGRRGRGLQYRKEGMEIAGNGEADNDAKRQEQREMEQAIWEETHEPLKKNR